MAEEQVLPYLIARRNDQVSFVLFGNGAIRRTTGATELVILHQEKGVRLVDITGEEHDTMATISMALFGY
jgi:hypothetical protein